MSRCQVQERAAKLHPPPQNWPEPGGGARQTWQRVETRDTGLKGRRGRERPPHNRSTSSFGPMLPWSSRTVDC